MSQNGKSESPAWEPGPFAVHIRRWIDPNDAAPTTILLRHPTAPFVQTDNEQSLQAFALDYLRAVDARVGLGLPGTWLAGLDDPEASAFRWMPIASRGGDGHTGSFWFERGPDDRRLDRTLVLLASQWAPKVEFLGSEFGIRVIAHARSNGGGADEVRITGMSASLPFGPYRAEPSIEDWESTGLEPLDLEDFLRGFVPFVAGPLHLQAESVFFRGFRVGKITAEDWQVGLRGRGLGVVEERHRSSAIPYEFFAVGSSQDGSDEPWQLRRVPLTACALPGEARVFPRDPTSQVGPHDTRKRRPSRPETARDPAAALDTYRVVERIAPGANADLGIPGRLEVPESRHVLEDLPPTVAKTVHLPGTGPAIRSNDFSAVNASRNIKALLARFDDYAINPAAYFNIAGLPIKGMYRSGIRPGPGKDGQTVNASVQPEHWPPGFPGPTRPGAHPVLEVHLALGDLSRRAREPWDGAHRSPAEPLGIAADARWVWHEFGHVLLMASVGELEFRFAHSAGDALAAIVADPSSDLVTSAAWRGVTFPWVFTPRRHDRCVHRGWSWSGSLHRALRLASSDPKRVRLKGYWSEQILSSSLFRAYRCLGGDTIDPASSTPARAVRQEASDYVVYLIVRGIGILGPSLVVPASQAEDFVAALVDADVGTVDMSGRIGGCANKVIRWAFEAQGLYPPDPDVINDAPGLPEPVDIYIEDQRPTVETVGRCRVDHGPGTYVPLSLDWGRYAPGGPAAGEPKWFMKDAAPTGGPLFVTVGNRGAQIATAVTVRVWTHAWPLGTNAPPWKAALWNASGTQPAQDIPSGATRQFGGYPLPTAPGRYLVFVQATSADDRANTDPATLYASSFMATPLADLVPSDNNLGLTVVEIP